MGGLAVLRVVLELMNRGYRGAIMSLMNRAGGRRTWQFCLSRGWCLYC